MVGFAAEPERSLTVSLARNYRDAQTDSFILLSFYTVCTGLYTAGAMVTVLDTPDEVLPVVFTGVSPVSTIDVDDHDNLYPE